MSYKITKKKFGIEVSKEDKTVVTTNSWPIRDEASADAILDNFATNVAIKILIGACEVEDELDHDNENDE